MDPLVMNIVFFIVCAVGAVFLIASICCLLKNCDFLRDDDDEDRNNEERYRPIRRKVLRKITSSLRRMTSRKTRALLYSMKTDKDPKCAICLDGLMVSEETKDKKKVIGLLNKCDHLFHFDCIWKWIENNSSCPICRTSMTVSTKNIQAISGAAMLTLLEKAGFDIKDIEKKSVPSTPELAKASMSSSSVSQDNDVEGGASRGSDVINVTAHQVEAGVTLHSPARSPRLQAPRPQRHSSRQPGRRLSDVNFMSETRPYVISLPWSRANVQTESGPAYVIPMSVNPSEYEWERVDRH